ncbi:MAG: hypothetical protein HY834_05255 [Devosia nanyangense]|uniref:Uncharacterized protein n=1 Tax=Devosia nanyangense TaxID=1228055 RepID=A0A933L155_9HYPH|nr:hypothetical protein [Devosia nanyangense]
MPRLVLGQPEHLARRIAERVLRFDEAKHPLLDGSGIALVHQEVGGQHQRHLAQMGAGLGGRDGIVGGDCFLGLAVLRQQCRLAEFCQGGVAAGALCDHRVERLLRRCEIGAVGQFGRRVELVGGFRGLGLLPPGPAFIAGHQQHDEHGGADDERPGLPPELAQAVAPQLLVYLTDKCIAGHENLGKPGKCGRNIVSRPSESKSIRQFRKAAQTPVNWTESGCADNLHHCGAGALPCCVLLC